MNLRLEDETVLEDPAEDEISALLDFLRAPGNTFAVLTREPWEFLRAERDPGHGYLLRWCEGAPEERFRSESAELDLAAVQRAFQAFAGRDPAWKDQLASRPDFFSVLADPNSPHYRRVLHSARTLWLQVAQSFGRLPTRVPWRQIRPLAERMARQVAQELAEEEERFRRHRETVQSDVRDALLELLGTVEAETEDDDSD